MIQRIDPELKILEKYNNRKLVHGNKNLELGGGTLAEGICSLGAPVSYDSYSRLLMTAIGD